MSKAKDKKETAKPGKKLGPMVEKVFKEMGAKAVRPRDIAERYSLSLSRAGMILGRLVQEKLVARVGYGLYKKL